MSKPDRPLSFLRRPWDSWRYAAGWGLAVGLFLGSVLIVWVDEVVWSLPLDPEYGQMHDPDQGRLLRREAARAFYLEQEQARRDRAGALEEK